MREYHYIPPYSRGEYSCARRRVAYLLAYERRGIVDRLQRMYPAAKQLSGRAREAKHSPNLPPCLGVLSSL